MITRIQLSTILIIAALLWGGALFLAGVDVQPEWMRPFSFVLGAIVLLIAASEKWLWRIHWLHPLFFNMPNLNGTWRVILRPTAPSSSPSEVEAYMVMRQTLSTIKIRMFTAESESETIAAKVYCCDDGTFTVAGVYRNTPRLSVRGRSPVHHGSILLSVQGDPPQALSGEYWTDRLSQGELAVTGRSSRQAHSFEQGKDFVVSAA